MLKKQSEMSELILEIAQKEPRQNLFIKAIRHLAKLYSVNRLSEYEQALTSVLVKYAKYNRLSDYFWIYRPYGPHPEKFDPSELQLLRIVLEKVLETDGEIEVQRGNGNLLSAYLVCFLTETDQKALDFLSKGAHTLREFEHRGVFALMGVGRITKETFLASFMQKFHTHPVTPDTLVIATCLLKDQKNVTKLKYYDDIKLRVHDLLDNYDKYSKEYQILSSVMVQLDYMDPSLEHLSPSAILAGRERLPKKVAILLSGQIRAVSPKVSSLISMMRERYQTDVFISTWRGKGKSAFRNFECRGYTERAKQVIFKTYKQAQINDLEFERRYVDNSQWQVDEESLIKDFHATAVDIEEDSVSTSLENNQNRMFYKVQRVLDLADQYGMYDVYVRIRPDLWFSMGFDIDTIIAKTTPNTIWTRDILFLAAQGIRPDDNFAIAGREAIQAYSDVISQSKNGNLVQFAETYLGKKEIIPHRSLGVFLMSNQIDIKNVLKFKEWHFLPGELLDIDDLLSAAKINSNSFEHDLFHKTFIQALNQAKGVE